MTRYFIVILLFLSIHSFSQSEISHESVQAKIKSLRIEKNLDSSFFNVFFCSNHFNIIPNKKEFYFFRDTLKLSNGIYSIGNVIVDTNLEFNGIKVGEWISYYPKGNLYSKGKYAIGAFTFCNIIGAELWSYNFKKGKWKYWYENGLVKASGLYSMKKIEHKTNCAKDSIFKAEINSKWYLNNSKAGENLD